MGPVAAFRQPRGYLVAVCGRWQGEMAGRGRSKRHSQAGGGASLRGRWVVWWMGQTPWAPSRWQWQGAQPSEGATELGFPGPVSGKMQSETAGRAGEPSGQGEEPPPEGLGGHHLLAQTDAHGPAGQVMRHHPVSSTGQALYRQPGAVGGEAARGRWLSPTPYLRSLMAFSTSTWRRWSASSSRVSPSRSVMKP